MNEKLNMKNEENISIDIEANHREKQWNMVVKDVRPGKKRRELSSDDLENLKRLRSAGVHGNPKKILEIFHECNESIEMTAARTEEVREERRRNRDERVIVRQTNSLLFIKSIFFHYRNENF